MVKRPTQKGHAFEALVVKELKVIFPEATRIAGSGNSKDDQGDIKNLGRYLAEAKHHRKVAYADIFGKSGWWHKISAEASRIGKEPLLIYRQNNQPIMVVERYVANAAHTLLLSDWINIERDRRDARLQSCDRINA